MVGHRGLRGRRDSLWEAAKKEINPDSNSRGEIDVQMHDWLRVPGKEGEPRQEQMSRALET